MTKILNKTSIETRIKSVASSPKSQWFPWAKQVRLFRKEDDGSIVLFSMFVFIMMLMIGGIAVDVMRSEYRRTRVQYTLDRAILASASLKQTVPPLDVVNDYFDKAGLSALDIDIDVDDGLNYRRVSADAVPQIGTMFMNMFGINTLATPTGGTAVDGVEKVEISLVLDVSGSMGWSSVDGIVKLDALKDAAKEFVDTLLLNAPEDDTYSISIVPYATQVTAGEDLLDQYNVTTEHDSSHCVDFTGGSFASVSLPTTTLLQRTGHFSPLTWGDSTRSPGDWSRACFTDSAREILPLSGQRNALRNYIDDLYADGWTSTEVGIKWGAALLDPTARPAVTGLISDSVVEAKFSGRPHEYTEESIMKVIVVMTDGANTNQYLLDDSVKDGLSPVWSKPKSNGDDRFWVYNEDRTQSKKYRRLFYDDDGDDLWRNAKWVNSPANGATQLSWQELWAYAPMEFVSDQLFDPASLDYDSWTEDYWTGFYSRVAWSEKDTRMSNICSATKANNVLIFTIGFEVSDSNATKLASCATTAAHFFRVEGVEISDAFASIAAQLNSLRLVR